MPREILIKSPRFVVGAARPAQFPGWDRPELAFGGRSNVGKSSILRSLMGQRSLVRVSRTPGRTRELNFFEVTLDETPCALVDLPGYGYAKVSHAIRGSWGPTLEQYLVDRRQLAGFVLLLDIRREPGPEERELLDLLAEHGRRVLVLATKSDQVPKNRTEAALRGLQQALDLRTKPVAFSALTGQGKGEVLLRLRKLVAPARPASGTLPATPPPPPLEITRATEADLDAIEAIEQRSFSSPWSRSALAEELERSWSFFFVGRVPGDDRIVAYANYWVVYDEIHLLNLATAPEARRQGHARRLLGDMIARGRAAASQLVVLEVRRTNLAAQALYTELGFQVIGERKGYYQDTREDALVYQLLL
jgi:GTP-binding protein